MGGRERRKAYGWVVASVAMCQENPSAAASSTAPRPYTAPTPGGVAQKVYEGQVVGEHCKDNDIMVNVAKLKHQTNIRAAGKDDAAKVRPPRLMSLEMSLEYIEDDELVEVTPDAVRIRKRFLKEADRRRISRKRK